MAVGIDFLRAVCAEQNVSLLHQVDATYFLDDERPFTNLSATTTTTTTHCRMRGRRP